MNRLDHACFEHFEYIKYELLIFKIKFIVNLKFHSDGDFQKTLLKEAGLLHNLRLESSLFHRYTSIIKRFLSCCSLKRNVKLLKAPGLIIRPDTLPLVINIDVKFSGA